MHFIKQQEGNGIQTDWKHQQVLDLILQSIDYYTSSPPTHAIKKQLGDRMKVRNLFELKPEQIIKKLNYKIMKQGKEWRKYQLQQPKA